MDSSLTSVRSSVNRFRRQFFALAGSLAGWVLLTGHSPYRQWIAYRQAHLLLFTTREDPGSDELGERLAARLRETLPDSKAQVARAPHLDRVASLLASAQADTAVLTPEQALALLRGEPPFTAYGAIPLRALAKGEGYVLVCRDEFKRRHAFLVAEALCRGDAPLLSLPDADDALPAHPGALAAAAGTPPDE
jgi:hypothetical protein